MNNVRTDSLYHEAKTSYLSGQYIMTGKKQPLYEKGRVGEVHNNLIDGVQVILGIFRGKKVKKIGSMHDGAVRGIWELMK